VQYILKYDTKGQPTHYPQKEILWGFAPINKITWDESIRNTDQEQLGDKLILSKSIMKILVEFGLTDSEQKQKVANYIRNKLTDFKRSQWTQRNTFVHGDTPKPKKDKNNGVKGERKQNPELIKEKNMTTDSTGDLTKNNVVQITKKKKDSHQFPNEEFLRLIPSISSEGEIQQPSQEIITLDSGVQRDIKHKANIQEERVTIKTNEESHEEIPTVAARSDMPTTPPRRNRPRKVKNTTNRSVITRKPQKEKRKIDHTKHAKKRPYTNTDKCRYKNRQVRNKHRQNNK
jgi:hypothetical protein